MLVHVFASAARRAQSMAEYTRDTPLRRFGTVAEVAALAVYRAFDESACMTGSELTLDGGMLAGTAVPPQPIDNRDTSE